MVTYLPNAASATFNVVADQDEYDDRNYNHNPGVNPPLAGDDDVISTDDANHVPYSRILVGGAVNDKIGMFVLWDVAETAGEIVKITGTLKGFGARSGVGKVANLEIWNHSGSTWETLSSQTVTTKTTFTGFKDSNLSNYFDASGDITLLFWVDDANDDADIDIWYVELELELGTPGGGGGAVARPQLLTSGRG